MVMGEGRWTHSSLYHSRVQAKAVLPRSLHHPQEPRLFVRCTSPGIQGPEQSMILVSTALSPGI